MRYIYFLLTLACLLSCTDVERRSIDLSDQIDSQPSDGIGHYVYALSLPKSVAAGEDFGVQMEWRTAGSVDPNARYTMNAILSGPDRKVYTVPAGANTAGEVHLANWLSYDFTVPSDFTPGNYTFGIKLTDEVSDGGDIPLGYKAELRMADGFYRLADIEVTSPSE